MVLADISPVPNNSRIVETLSQNGFVVYALGCGSLARIHQTRAWWWSPVVAVKPFLAPIADAHACWDFSESPYVCGSPQAAAVCKTHPPPAAIPSFPQHAPVGCHNASDPNPFSLVSLPYDPDTEPVFSTAMYVPMLLSLFAHSPSPPIVPPIVPPPLIVSHPKVVAGYTPYPEDCLLFVHRVHDSRAGVLCDRARCADHVFLPQGCDRVDTGKHTPPSTSCTCIFSPPLSRLPIQRPARDNRACAPALRQDDIQETKSTKEKTTNKLYTDM